MRISVRVLAILAAGAAALSGATPPRPQAFAIEGALQNPANGHWYKVITSSTKLYWTACKVNAESIGGYLATMNSAEENSWVWENVIKSGYCWIGASDASVEGTWQWVTGEPFSFNSWAPGEPNNASGIQHYALTGARGGPYWDDGANDGWGSSIYSYAVEWDGNPALPSPPNAPSDLTASVSAGDPISLQWCDNSDNEEEFQVERRDALTPYSRNATLGPNSTIHEDVATAPGTSYTYRVRAVNSGGASDWSNEATVTASPIAPGPRAPSGLTVISATRDSIELWWSDNSVDEIGFEVHRCVPGGAFGLVETLSPGASLFTDSGLPPDAAYEYGVRAVNLYRASGFCTVEAATLPTLSVTATRADLRDSPRFGRDSMRVQALFDFLPESPDGLCDVLAEGIGLRVGPVDRPVTLNLPENLDTWMVRGTKATWKSPRGSTPKYSLRVDTERRTVRATAAGLEFAEPPANPMRVSITIGDDGGTARGDWETKKPGVFRLR